MDPSSRESPGSLSEAGSIGLKSCEYCRTTKTPLWRGGPSGPKSLCNACGIRYRKTRRESTAETSPKKESKGEVEMGLKLQLLGIKSIMKQSSSSSSSSSSIRKRSRSSRRRSSSSSCFYWVERQQRRNLGEVEKAAVLLMALSSGIFL